MDPRIDYSKAAPGVLQAMLGIEKYLGQSGIERPLLDLVHLRASQINGCAYCIDMHWKDLRAEGESEQKRYGLDAWAESPYYSDRERAALAWTEAVTRLDDGHVADPVYNAARRFFSEKELADLTLCIVAINGWNRLNVALRTPAGSYQAAEKVRTRPEARDRRPEAPGVPVIRGARLSFAISPARRSALPRPGCWLSSDRRRGHSSPWRRGESARVRAPARAAPRRRSSGAGASSRSSRTDPTRRG